MGVLHSAQEPNISGSAMVIGEPPFAISLTSQLPPELLTYRNIIS